MFVSSTGQIITTFHLSIKFFSIRSMGRKTKTEDIALPVCGRFLPGQAGGGEVLTGRRVIFLESEHWAEQESRIPREVNWEKKREIQP